MERPNWPQNWERYPKHRKATTRDWDSGLVLKWSAAHESHAQYNPYGFGSDEDVEELEVRCVNDGTPICMGETKWTFYLNVYRVVGVCCGQETDYVFAEWNLSGGAIHGRPISKKALRAMGVTV